MPVPTCAQCGAPNAGDLFAVAWTCRHCGSQNFDASLTAALKDRIIAGIAACEREEWPTAIRFFDEAIVAGVKGQRVLANAALAIASNAEVPTLDVAAKQMDRLRNLWAENTYPRDPEVASIWQQAQERLARTTLRAMRYHIGEGDKAFFGYQEVDLPLATRMRSEEYARAVAYAKHCVFHPPADATLLRELLATILHCCRTSPEACDSEACSIAAKQAGEPLVLPRSDKAPAKGPRFGLWTGVLVLIIIIIIAMLRH